MNTLWPSVAWYRGRDDAVTGAVKLAVTGAVKLAVTGAVKLRTVP